MCASGVVNVTINKSIREGFSHLCLLFSSALFIHTTVTHHKASKRTNTELCVKHNNYCHYQSDKHKQGCNIEHFQFFLVCLVLCPSSPCLLFFVPLHLLIFKFSSPAFYFRHFSLVVFILMQLYCLYCTDEGHYKWPKCLFPI